MIFLHAYFPIIGYDNDVDVDDDDNVDGDPAINAIDNYADDANAANDDEERRSRPLHCQLSVIGCLIGPADNDQADYHHRHNYQDHDYRDSG